MSTFSPKTCPTPYAPEAPTPPRVLKKSPAMKANNARPIMITRRTDFSLIFPINAITCNNFSLQTY